MSRLSTLVIAHITFQETGAKYMGPVVFMRRTLYNKEQLSLVFKVDLPTRLHIVRTFAELHNVMEQICLD